MDWEPLDSDREIFERELQRFIPQEIFDSHAHLYEKAYFKKSASPFMKSGPEFVGWKIYREEMAKILPGRQCSGLFFGFPFEDGDIEAANSLVAQEVRNASGALGQMLVRPEMDPEYIRETVRREKFVGLKCYHVYANESLTMNALIPSYLPEDQVRIAHEENLSITLHIVRPRALADPSNQRVIRRYAERYPQARLILAHAARGFNPYHTVEGIHALQGLPNVWFDTAAVTEAGAFEAIVRTMGVERLLYGSDFPVSHMRGRCVAVGDSFRWLSPENTNFTAERTEMPFSLIGIESLRALKLACLNLKLSDKELEAVFYGNAVKCFRLSD